MLNEIALSIATLVFFLCTFVVNSMAPDLPAEPLEPIVQETLQEVFAEAEDYRLVGKWNSCGRIFEFTASGKLLYNNQSMPYEVENDCITVVSRVNGEDRTYRLSFEAVNERVIKLGGVAMYRMNR